MKNITLTKLRKELKFKSREDLQADIELLFKQFPQVKKHYTMLYESSGIDEVLEEAKQKIHKEFHGNARYGCPRASIKDAKKVITNFKKLPVTDENIIDLMLCYVDELLGFIREYGVGYDTNYPDSCASMFESAIKIIQKNQLYYHYENILKDLLRKADDGYVEDIEFLYDEYFGENQQ